MCYCFTKSDATFLLFPISTCIVYMPLASCRMSKYFSKTCCALFISCAITILPVISKIITFMLPVLSEESRKLITPCAGLGYNNTDIAIGSKLLSTVFAAAASTVLMVSVVALGPSIPVMPGCTSFEEADLTVIFTWSVPVAPLLSVTVSLKT